MRLPGVGVERKGSYCLMGTELQFCKMKRFKMLVIVTQQCKYA